MIKELVQKVLEWAIVVALLGGELVHELKL
jgi:hypothetical protein